MVSCGLDLGHVVDSGSDVLAGDVAATEALDRGTDRAQQRRVLAAFGIRHHHHFGAAKGDSGDRRLQGHALRKPEHITQRRGLVCIGQNAAAADGGPQVRAVNGDDRAQTTHRVGHIHDLLVLGKLDRLEDAHEDSFCSGMIGISGTPFRLGDAGRGTHAA